MSQNQGRIWEDKPKIQVIMSTYNVEKYLEKCLFSIERALKGFNWILIITDDCSSDSTWSIISDYKSNTADKVIIEKFGKSVSIGQARNRAIALGQNYRKDYQAIVLMDADDVMGRERVSHLLSNAIKHNKLVTIGNHFRIGRDFLDHETLFSVRESAGLIAHFGPWATLFHSSLIPENNLLFREDVRFMEDTILFAEWMANGVSFMACPGPIVHYYFRRREGVYTNHSDDIISKGHKRWLDIKYSLFYGKTLNFESKRDITFYYVFSEYAEIEKFTKVINSSIDFLAEFPNIQFVILDRTRNRVAESIINYPFAKEIAYGGLKYFHVSEISEKESNQKLINAADSNYLCLLPWGMKLNSFLISKLMSLKPENNECFGEFIVFNKGVMI